MERYQQRGRGEQQRGQDYRNPRGSYPRQPQQQDRRPTASAVRTKNFGYLVQAAGDEESLGIALGIPLKRVQDLRNGFDFTNETAFHIESELNLDSGWLDRPNAQIPEKLMTSPKDPDEMTTAELTPAATKQKRAAAGAPAPAAAGSPRASSTRSGLIISAPGLVSEAASNVAPTLEAAPAPVQAPAPAPSAAATPAQIEEVKETPMPTARSPRINEPEDLMAIRRANVHVLTDFPGGKTGIGVLMGKSPANISHVLHGKKKFTRDVGVEFEQALQLPDGWLDTPKTPADVPEAVKAAIQGAFNSKDKATAPRTPAAKTPRAAAAPRAAAQSPRAPSPAPSPVATSAAAPSPAAPAASPAAPAVSRMLSPASAASTPSPARQTVNSPAVPTQLGIDMGEMGAAGSGHLAQALVRIIIELSRTQQLSERDCLKLIQQVTEIANPERA